jgi:glycosyltransferase involved in cell wall biosynthesis
MAMGRALVCSKTRGQTDALVDGVTGIYVPPGDPQALREAIEHLLEDPRLASELGQAARAWAVAHADIAIYADRLGAHVDLALRPVHD